MTKAIELVSHYINWQDLGKDDILMREVWEKDTAITIKKVRKYGEGRMTLCAETGNRCFGRVVYEDLHTGGLAVIVSLVSGDFLVDLDTFLNAHRFFEDMEALG